MEAGFCLRHSIRRVDIRRELGEELLLLCIEKSQQRWFEHPGYLPLEVYKYIHLEGDLVVDPEQRDFISHLSLEHLRIPHEELDNVAVRNIWNFR